MRSAVKGRTVLSNAGIALGGQATSSVFALVVYPVLLHRLGLARFGFLSLVWTIVGVSGLLDFGIGRALTRLVAGEIGRGDDERVRALVQTAFVTLFGIATLAFLALQAGAPALVGLLRLPAGLQTETQGALRMLAFVVPAALASSASIAVLEGHQDFVASSGLRTVSALASLALPAVVAVVTPDLRAVVGGLVCGRAAVALLGVAVCARKIGWSPRPRHWEWARQREIWAIGGWISASNLASPIMGTLDRMLLGSLRSIETVAAYSAPADVVMRLLVIPSALGTATFPALASQPDAGDVRMAATFRTAWYTAIGILAPVCTLTALLAPFWVPFWLGKGTPPGAVVVAQIVAIGVLWNGAGVISYAYAQATGPTITTGALHLIELVLYVPLVWLLVSRMGAAGAAWAWTLRVGSDALILSSICALRSRPLRPILARGTLVLGVLSALGLLLLAGRVAWN